MFSNSNENLVHGVLSNKTNSFIPIFRKDVSISKHKITELTSIKYCNSRTYIIRMLFH